MSGSLDLFVQSNEGSLSYDLQANAVCTKVHSSVKRVTATACSPISTQCNSACALDKSKTKAMTSFLEQLYEAYPTQVAGGSPALGLGFASNQGFGFPGQINEILGYDSDSDSDF